MKDKKFAENVENIYITLSDEQKIEYKLKEDKFNKSFIVMGVVLAIILVAVIIGLTIYLTITKEYYALAFSVGFCLILSIMPICIIKSSYNGFKITDEIKIKKRIDRLEKQKQWKQEEKEKQLQKKPYYRLAVDKIVNVSILDSYTEYSDKLHAVLNFQEIIQTRIYKFKVNYIDGNSKIVTAAENFEEYNLLVPYINKTATAETSSQNNDNIAKLREYKQLLDDGIITPEEFETKKKELL